MTSRRPRAGPGRPSRDGVPASACALAIAAAATATRVARGGHQLHELREGRAAAGALAAWRFLDRDVAAPMAIPSSAAPRRSPSGGRRSRPRPHVGGRRRERPARRPRAGRPPEGPSRFVEPCLRAARSASRASRCARSIPRPAVPDCGRPRCSRSVAQGLRRVVAPAGSGTGRARRRPRRRRAGRRRRGRTRAAAATVRRRGDDGDGCAGCGAAGSGEAGSGAAGSGGVASPSRLRDGDDDEPRRRRRSRTSRSGASAARWASGSRYCRASHGDLRQRPR